MDEQKDIQQDKPRISKNIWIATISIIISALMISIGFFMLQELRLKNIEQVLQQELSGLKTKINEFTEQNLQQQIFKSEIQVEEIEENQNINEQQIEDTSVIDEKNTDDWLLYRDDSVGFSLKYPKNIIINEPKKKFLTLFVNSWRMGTGDSIEYDIKEQQELEKGNYGRDIYSGVPESKKVINLGSVNGKEIMCLNAGDSAGMSFIRKLVFYYNNQVITIELWGDIDKLMSENLQYLTDEKLCSDCEPFFWWGYENNKQSQFYKDLTGGLISGDTKIWYDLFDDIVSTIEIY